MNIRISTAIAAAVLACGIASTGPVFAAARPCEDVLKEFRDAKATAKPDAATLKKVEDLEAKGVERCNADDDKRADAFFADAMKLLGK
ncbi:hypothetical protein FHS82_003716 [Pseudochelatococcus lubricantis]|uniref:Uncharacterized protein n=1 Tax=Pseudochelatococcus lubricantis TaxID=1538102 RepID=A0ABX0V5U8_9HYPH|nr:hypothetical protein [Pseudochelatococcus lubricantis]NIJ59855.1 hypothetical protein [Pseudochelatococcus lubricantis]